MATKKAPKAKASKKATKAAKPKKSSAKQAKVDPIPSGYNSVIPYANVKDAKAMIAFCKSAVGAKMRGKPMLGPNGSIVHCELDLGDSVLMLSEAVQQPEWKVNVFCYVPNVDKVIAKALKAGASLAVPAMDMFWGDRMGCVIDPVGNQWTFASRFAIVSPAEMKKGAAKFAADMAAQQG